MNQKYKITITKEQEIIPEIKNRKYNFSIKDKCKEGYSSCKEKEECVNDGFKDYAEREEEMKCIEEGYNSCEEKNNSIEHFSNNEMDCSCKCKKN